MKKMKKLLSVVVVGAMALSLCATAFATPVTNFNNPVGDTIDATGSSQGAIPAKPISIKLPTVPDRTAANVVMPFDFILDPHGLINQTDAAAYKPADGEAPKFAEDTNMYFQNVSSTGSSYSGTSDALKVTNTGFVPVDIDLELAFEMNDSKFELVNAASALENKENEDDEDPGAQMFLQLVADTLTKPVMLPESTNPKAVIDDEAGYIDGDVAIEYATEASDPDDSETVEAFEEALEAFKAAVANATIVVTYVAPEDPDNDDPAIHVELDTLTGFSATAVDIDDPDALDVEMTIVHTESSEEVATISFTVVEPDPDNMSEDDETTITFTVPTTGAKIETALGVLADSYTLDNTKDADEKADLIAAGVQVSSMGYYWKQGDAETSEYPTLKFNLVGNINNSDAWDEEIDATTHAINGSDVEFTLTWDVREYDKTANRDQVTTPDSGDPTTPPDNSTQPTVTLNRAATGTTAAKGALIDWTAGTGTYAGYEPTKVVWDGESDGVNLTVMSETQVRLTCNATVKAGSNHKIVFEADGKGDIQIALPADCW